MIAKPTFELTLKTGRKLMVEALNNITEQTLQQVRASKKFNDYIRKIECAPAEVQVSKIEIVNVIMFRKNVGFISLKAYTVRDGFSLPNFVFLRGAAVCVLMLVNDKLLVIEQYRVPVQRLNIAAPAGMLDESGDFVGTAAEEIEEQTSIKITKDQLHPLGSFYPSVGGCDEETFMYYCQLQLPEQQIKAVEAKIHGKEDGQQRIRVKLMDKDPASILATKDSMLICMMMAYDSLKNKKKEHL